MARPGLTQHRKFRRLVRALGSPIIARGALELMWDGCYDSGNDYVGTAEDIEHAVAWSGEAGMLTRALAEAGAPLGVGFIERLEGDGEPVYRVHDLWHHAPDYVSNRRTREDERRREKACQRCGQTYFAADPRSAYCSPACRQGGWRDRRNGPVTDRDVTVTDRNGSVARAPSTRTQHAKEVISSTAPAPTEPPVLVFPIIGKGLGEWSLTPSLVAEWEGLFPGLDVQAECRSALAWVRAKPTRRKTARGMQAFLVGWFTRTVDRRGPSPERRDAPRETPDRRLYDLWREKGCPHTPRCSNFTTCQVVSARAS